MQAQPSKSKLKRLRRKMAKQSQTLAQIAAQDRGMAMAKPASKKRAARRAKRRGASGIRGDYLKSLLDPENYPGCKVPDLVTAPSGTFQVTFDQTLATTGTGDGVSVVLSPAYGTSSATPNASNGYTLGVFQNVAAGGVYSTATYYNPSNYTAVQGLYESLRPVSAVLYAEFIGNTLNDAGQIVMGWRPSAPVGGNQYTPVARSFTDLQAQPFTRTIPLRNGAKVLWKPEDNSSLEFTQFGDKGIAWPPVIYVGTVGQPVSTTFLRIRAVINFEGLPLTDTTTLVNAAPSPVQLGEVQQAFSWLSGPYTNLFPFVGGIASAFAVPAGVGYLNTGVNLARAITNRGAIGRGRLPSGSLPEMGYA